VQAPAQSWSDGVLTTRATRHDAPPAMHALPIRETFWNIPSWAVVGVYIGGALAITIFAWGVWRRVAVWRAGGPEMRWDRIPTRIARVVKEVLLQSRILRQSYPGIMHATMFWGFLALLTGTVLATIDWEVTRLLFDVRILKGPFYLGFELALDLFGLFLLIGLGMAVWRRFVLRPVRLDPAAKFAYALAILFVIVLTGFLIEACRLAVTQPAWAPWSPAGWALAQALLAAGAGEGALRDAHASLWVFHAVLVFTFIALIPHSYFFHFIATPLNVFLAKLGPRGALAKIENLEEQETFGVSHLAQFSWKRRLDFDACTECGRCHAVCCSQLSGGVLSPKRVIGNLRRAMHEGHDGPLHGSVVSADELWACTTCMACVEECPARIDIVDTIVDLRRYLALSEGSFPSTGAAALQHIQGLGNPWGLDPGDRLAWAKGLDVPVLTPDQSVDVLYWVGCAAAYDPRAQKVARAVVKILRRAGISFGVMAEERCHGEVGRRMGEEYLYQTATAENIGNLRRHAFRRILTHCPHCFNTIKNEYPQFENGDFEVVHHSELIADLIRSGRISPASAQGRTVVFHDPCYLGRQNGVFEAPRAALAGVKGLDVVELPRNRERGVCCGGGGGQSWMEVSARKRINIVRTEEIVASGADVAAVGCPFCLSMLDEGRKTLGVEERLPLRDLAELVADALPET
jgi:Fe-S oxidoreductase/nitrate reductase gamma subunit